MTIRELEDELDWQENRGWKQLFSQEVFSISVAAMAMILFLASCTGCGR